MGVFDQALGRAPGVTGNQSDPSTNAYQMLLQELQNPVKVATGPSFSPEEVRQRIAQNNQLIQLGALGSVAGDERVNKFGGTVFKQALSDRDERQTDRGIQDPLTGETKIDPEYAAGQERARRGQVLQQALGYQKSREDAADRMAREKAAEAARLQQAREHNETLRAVASTRAGAAGAGGKPPPGFRWTPDGNLEAIPGGPAANRIVTAENKAVLGENALLGNIDNVIAKAQDAAGKTGFWTTGTPGQILGKVRGSEAYDLRKTLDTVKANLGFNELSAMRQASPTGGALGQVAVQELNYLQAARANLDAEQSEDQLKKSLSDVIGHYTKWKNVIQQHQRERQQAPGYPTPSLSPGAMPVGGAGAAPAGPTPQPAAPQGTPRRRYDPATGQLVPM
jgi:hypothetical protein